METESHMVEKNPFIVESFNTHTPVGATLLCLKNFNCGRPTFTTSMSMFQLFQHTDVANDRLEEKEQSQRSLDITHAKGLALYILKSLLEAALLKKNKHGEVVSEKFFQIIEELGRQPYYSIAPLVANVRTLAVEDVIPLADKNGKVVTYQITLRHGDVLWIIDGQHRRKAVELVYDFLSQVTSYHKYPKGSFYITKTKEKLPIDEVNVWNAVKEISKWCEVTLEVHLGLTIQQERQLFHDLNNKAKKVEKSLAYKFDNSNPVNSYISSTIIETIFDQRDFQIGDKDEVKWEEENPSISRKQLVAVNAILFLNKSNISGALPADVTEYKKQIANQFWNYVLDIPGMLDKQHKLKTTVAQPVVLKAIAKLYYDVYFGKNEDLKNEEIQNRLIEGLETFDFSHINPVWRYYMLKAEERKEYSIDGLSEYLPKDEDGKIRDLGAYDEKSKTFRFATTHNDVFPLIGDIIRWHCNLPSRNK